MGARQAYTIVSMALISLSCLAGCSSSDYELAPVSGVVTLDGHPIDGALVIVQPVAKEASLNAGPGSFGKTNERGEFSLELVRPAVPGAVVGSHRVRINKVTIRHQVGKEDAPVAVQNPLPRSATDGSLSLTVPSEGTDQIRFDLKSKQ